MTPSTTSKGSPLSLPRTIIAGYMPDLLDLTGEEESVAFAWQRVIRDSTLPSTTKLGGYALASRMNKKGQCRPSVATLAMDMGVGISTARRAKASLISLGLITITNEGQKKADGSFATHRLQAAFPPLTDLSGEVGGWCHSDSTPSGDSTLVSERQYPWCQSDSTYCQSDSTLVSERPYIEDPIEESMKEPMKSPRNTFAVATLPAKNPLTHFIFSARRGVEAARLAHVAEIETSTPTSPSLGQLWQKRNDRLSRLPA